MKKMSLKTKSAIAISLALAVYVAFSIIISFIFFSDALSTSGSVIDAESTKTQFFIIFTCAEILVGVVIVLMCMYLINSFVVKPLVKIRTTIDTTDIGDNEENMSEAKCELKQLDINSGDEIEDLYHSLMNIQLNFNELVANLKKGNWEAEHDNMTVLNNRVKFEVRRTDVYPHVDTIYIARVNVVNLRKINEVIGTEAGDSIITKVGRELRRLTCDTIHTYRFEADDFVIVMCGYLEEEAISILTKWNKRVGRLNRQTDPFDCVLVWGGAYAEGDFSVDEIMKKAEAEMCCQKMIIKNELSES